MTGTQTVSLGTPLQEFKSGTYVIVAYIFIGFLGLLGLTCLVVSILGFAGILKGLAYEPVQIGFGSFMGALVLGGLAGWKYYTVKANREKAVMVYSEGFVKVSGNKIVPCRWSEIQAIKIYTRTEKTHGIKQSIHSLLIRRTDGQLIDLGDNRGKNHFSNIKQLMDIIQEKSLIVLFPQMLQSLSSGGTLSFGSFQADRSGVKKDGKAFTWETLGWVELDYLKVKILDKTTNKKHLLGNISQIENLHCFKELVRYFNQGDSSK